jgi:hypothetical protein
MVFDILALCDASGYSYSPVHHSILNLDDMLLQKTVAPFPPPKLEGIRFKFISLALDFFFDQRR